MTFSEEAFLAQKPGAPLQAFHRRAVHLQLFKQVSRSPGGGAGARGAGARGAGLGLVRQDLLHQGGRPRPEVLRDKIYS